LYFRYLDDTILRMHLRYKIHFFCYLRYVSFRYLYFRYYQALAKTINISCHQLALPLLLVVVERRQHQQQAWQLM